MADGCRRAKLKRLCQFEAGEQHQIVGHHGRPDLGLEVVEPAPSAARTAMDAFEAGDASFDPGAEVCAANVAFHKKCGIAVADMVKPLGLSTRVVWVGAISSP